MVVQSFARSGAGSARQSEDRSRLDAAALRYADIVAHGSPAQRSAASEELVRQALPFVHGLARMYRQRGEPLEDLQQSASLGLMLAIGRFDPARGPFSAYVAATVVGELKRHFRDRTWGVHVPRQLQELSQEARRGTAALTQRLARAPTEAELAREVGVPVGDIRLVRRSNLGYRPASLDAPLRSGDDTGGTLAEQLGESDGALDAVDERVTVRRLLARLPRRERQIVNLRFYGNKTQAEIAQRFGISQMHVSRLLSRTLAWLRVAMLTDETPAWRGQQPDGWPPSLWLRRQVRKDVVRIRVDGEVDVDTAGQLRYALLETVEGSGTGGIEVDLGGVPLVDAAGVAALLAGYEASRAAGRPYRITGASALVVRVLQACGLSPLLAG
ncbi:sigma-70 family RNA polymerase sigma factor [Plantactinospora sp. WMMB782]|uniref:sigma-70 family RNA polymerase sigma factor n=1 Tax=Plantactinospora sp. WMMB782 TaxID=3404121 RepID=UPI003B9421F5